MGTEYKKSRVFGGKRYDLIHWYERKAEASGRAKEERKKGHLVRIETLKYSNWPTRYLVYRRFK